MYFFAARIRYSEVDSNAKLTVESLIDYFQDCSTFQTQDGPATMEYLREKGMAWVLNSWQIVINRLPRIGEEVTIGTVPYMLRGPLGLRNFFMDSKDGERLSVANSVWTLFDYNKGAPCKVTPEIIEAYPIEPKLEMNYEDRKIAIPTERNTFKCEEIVVRAHHLDTNNHVNNGQYVRMAIDCIPDKKEEVVGLRAEYKKQTLLGDILYPVVIERELEDNNIYTVSLNREDGLPACIVELKTIKA